MSTLNVSNITDGTDTVGTSYVVNGSAKAFANFDGTGALTIRSSLNGSSITDIGTGRHALNFTSSFSDTNYMPVGVGSSTGSSAEMNTRFEVLGLTMTNASWKEIQILNDNAQAYIDVTHLSILCHGDLA